MTKYLITAAIGKPFEERFRAYHDERFRQYADHWGMIYVPTFTHIDTSPHTNYNWAKIKIIRDMLPKCDDGDIIVWLDADICIVRGDKEITTDKDLGITFDLWNVHRPVIDLANENVFEGHNRMNTGIQVVKNSEFTRHFYQRIFSNMKYENHPYFDQGPFIEEMQISLREGKVQVEVLPREFNVTTVSAGIPDDQILFRHFAGEFHSGWDPRWENTPIKF